MVVGYVLDGQGSILDRGKSFSTRHSVQTRSGAHPASYPMGTGCVKLTTELHLVPRSRMVELYLYSPTSRHDVVLNYFKHRDNFAFFYQNVVI
jgi:hypothetical protein